MMVILMISGDDGGLHGNTEYCVNECMQAGTGNTHKNKPTKPLSGMKPHTRPSATPSTCRPQ